LVIDSLAVQQPLRVYTRVLFSLLFAHKDGAVVVCVCVDFQTSVAQSNERTNGPAVVHFFFGVNFFVVVVVCVGLIDSDRAPSPRMLSLQLSQTARAFFVVDTPPLATEWPVCLLPPSISMSTGVGAGGVKTLVSSQSVARRGRRRFDDDSHAAVDATVVVSPKHTHTHC
jgi:hypothetical protein